MIVDALQVASSLGLRFDSLFSLTHGTPEQRGCAVRSGADMALKSNGTVLSPRAFNEMFEDKKWRIVTLDPETCYVSGPNSTLRFVDCPFPKSPALFGTTYVVGICFAFFCIGALLCPASVAKSTIVGGPSIPGVCIYLGGSLPATPFVQLHSICLSSVRKLFCRSG